jgi:hypothetical protein
MTKLLSLLFAISLLFFGPSCKKDYQKQPNDELVLKVNSWLENQKSPSQPNKAANIETLKNNVDFSRSWVEASDGGEQILIIPINEKFRSVRNIDNKSILNLVIMLNNSGKIRRGNIVMYYPKNSAQRNVPRNTFYAIYNTAEPSADGEFRFLSVTGRSLYRLKYENQRLRSAGHIKSGQEIASRTSDVSVVTCTEWYLVTTYYDEDGNIVGQTSEYLHTTCSGCDDGMNEGHCQDDPGSGGGGGGEVVSDYEYERGATRLWTVSRNPLEPTDTRVIWSRERLRYKLVATEPQGGHFTQPYNTARGCDFCGMNDTWTPTYNWWQPDPQTQNLTVRNDLWYQARNLTFEDSNSWTMESMPH